MKAYDIRVNNMGITIPEPTEECVRATINEPMFKIFMPDDNIREDMIKAFVQKIKDGDYKEVEVEDKK